MKSSNKRRGHTKVTNHNLPAAANQSQSYYSASDKMPFAAQSIQTHSQQYPTNQDYQPHYSANHRSTTSYSANHRSPPNQQTQLHVDPSHPVTSSAMPSPAVSSASRRTQRSNVSTTAARALRRLQDAINIHLNQYEKELLLDSLNLFYQDKEMYEFVETLRTILNTPAKQLLVAMIRAVLPKHFMTEFDKCVQISIAACYGNKSAERLINENITTPRQSRSNTPRQSRNHTPRQSIRASSRSSSRRNISAGRGNTSPMKKDEIIIQITPDRYGAGFTINQSKSGLVVGHVDVDSPAYAQGLRKSDQILELNQIDLNKAGFSEAKKILSAARNLTLSVRKSDRGELNDTKISHHDDSMESEYSWVDSRGLTCSPPPTAVNSNLNDFNTMRSSVSKRSGMTLLSSQDERRITLHVDRGLGVGLTIRGGSEFNLGIYITSVDVKSAAETAGLLAGDQILDINGEQFIDISHKQAVKILRKSKHMILTVKHVGKLPHSKSQSDGRSLSSAGSVARSRSLTRHEDKGRRHRYPGSLDRKKYYENEADERNRRSVFSKGAGSQLMFGFSMATPPPRHAEEVGVSSRQDEVSSRQDMTSRKCKTKLEETMRHVLNDSERGTVKYYIHEYSKGRIDINGFVVALKELLNSRAKMSLLREIKPLISPHDIMKYEALILEYQIYPQTPTNRTKSKTQDYVDHEDTSDFSLDSVLSAASSNDELTNQIARNLHSANQITTKQSTNQTSRSQNGMGSKPKFVTDGSSRSVTTEVTQSNSMRRKLSREEMNHAYHRQEESHTYRVQELDQAYHIDINPGMSADSLPSSSSRPDDSPAENRPSNVPAMGMRSKINKSEIRNPSEDSGVDIKVRTEFSSQAQSLDRSEFGSEKGESLSLRPDLSDDSSTDSPRRRSYRVHKNTHDSETETESYFNSDNELPRENNSQHDDFGRVILKSQKHIGTLPRYRDNQEENNFNINQLFNSGSGTQPSFGQQLKSRQILSGKLYSQPQTTLPDQDDTHSDGVATPAALSDYDTADILNISQQIMSDSLRAAAGREEGKNSPDSSLPEYPTQCSITRGHSDTPSPTPSFPPPPLSQTVTPIAQRKLSNAHANVSLTDQSSRRETGSNIYESIRDSGDWELSSHSGDNSSEIENRPIPTSSPTIEPKVRGRNKSDNYSVVKKHSENISRRSVIEIHNNQQDVPTTQNNTPNQTSPTEELIQVNKIKSTLGLAIEGGSGTKQPIPRIINIQETGCAYTSNLKVGHVIRRINDKSLEGLTHIQAARTIADAFRDRTSGYMEFLVTYQPEHSPRPFKEKMNDNLYN